MANVNEYLSELKQLLAPDRIDGSRGVLFGTAFLDGAGLKVNENDQFLLIGLGGTGIKTVDYVKGELSRRMEKGWQKFIRFIGIDADGNEIAQAAYLTRAECQIITDSKIKEKIQDGPSKWPYTWHHITDTKTIQSLDNKNPHEAGSGRLRVLGKMKLHDKEGTEPKGYDELIRDKIEAASSAMGAPRGQMYVFVVGSLCGGTCSGGITEMPPLIRAALKGKPCKIYALLYLPDTLSANPDIPKPTELQANGFAALKELDYYNGLIMRSGYDGEHWYINDVANQVITMPSGQDFIDLPILVGTREGANPESSRIAQETIAEFLLSMVGQYSNTTGTSFTIQSAFSNTATSMDRRRGREIGVEEAGHHHNVPRVYGAIGFAESSAPVKTVRAYVVSEVCKASGVRSVSRERWNDQLDDMAIPPFRGKDNYLTAQKGTMEAQKIIQPLEDAIRGVIYNGHCKLTESEDGEAPYVYNWQTVKQDELYNSHDFKEYLADIVKSQTETDAITRMERDLRAAYGQFRLRVEAFVHKEGPFAFVNLYHGKFIPNGSDRGTGVKEMLENLYNGKLAQGGQVHLTTVASAESNEKECTEALAKERSGLFREIAQVFVGDRRSQLINAWLTSVEEHQIAKINEARGKLAFGRNNAFYDQVYVRADKLTQDLLSFGEIIDSMVDIYDSFGSVLPDEQKFANACDNASEVNLASLSNNSYRWIRNQADADIKAANGMAVRKALVSSFFEMDDSGLPNSRNWLSIPDNRILIKEGRPILTNHDVAIPAREMFDKVVASIPNNLNVSISALFKQSAPSTAEQKAMAYKVVKGLAERSLPLFHGSYDSDNCIRTLIYPASLDAAIAADLREAANEVFAANGNAINCYASNDTSSIRILQVVTPLEMYRLTRLADWERVYESKLREGDAKYLHGYAPGTTFHTDEDHNLHVNAKRSWREYPSPVGYTGDPRRIKDFQTGSVIWEGQRQISIDGVVDAARNLGLLYAVDEGSSNQPGWVIRVARLQPDWKLDIQRIAKKNKSYPTGKDLVAEVARQNGTTLDDISVNVQLQHAGIFSDGAHSEKEAWNRARKVLYVHIPMLEQLDASIEWLKVRAEEVILANEEYMNQIKCSKFPAILSAGLIFERDNAWLVKTDAGEVQILNMDFQRRKPRFRAMEEAGCVYAYIYQNLMNAPELENGSYEALFQKAEAAYAELEEGINRSDFDAIEEEKEWMDRVSGLKAEIDSLKERYGLQLGGSMKPTKRFMEALRPSGPSDRGKLTDSEIMEVLEFYSMASEWERWPMDNE